MVVETQIETQTHFKGQTTSFPGFIMVRHLAQQGASGKQDLRPCDASEPLAWHHHDPHARWNAFTKKPRPR